MSFVSVALIAGGGALLGGVLSADAAKSAANTQANAANNATGAQLQMFNTINSQQAPFREAGYTALSDIGAGKDFFTHQFNAGDLNANLAPNYQFQLDQGLGAVKNSASSMGGFVGGNTLKAINDYAQNYAGNAYQQAFNNYSANQSNIFNRLATIAGIGNAANTTSANAGSTISGNAANSMMAAGAAQAAGRVGSANAITGGINNATGWYALNNILNRPPASAVPLNDFPG